MKLQLTLLAGLALTQACLTPEEIQAERHMEIYGDDADYVPLETRKKSKKPIDYGFAIGKGDRFDNGAVAPVGIGVANKTFASILNMDEVVSGLKGLENVYGSDVKLFSAPYLTFEGRTHHGLTVGEPRVYIQSGIHARERGATDAALYFAADLLYARDHGIGLSYGNKNYTHKQVLKAISAGFAVVPALNPDGIVWDQTTNTCWRKNRNTTHAKEGKPKTVGIDLNRNYDFLWHYKKDFLPQSEVIGLLASDKPANEGYHGASPASEAETRNSQWTMNHFGNLSWFIDIHSTSSYVLYMWGDDDVQTTKPYENFMNKTYNGDRGVDAVYGPANLADLYAEYVEEDDLVSQNTTAHKIARHMSHAGDYHYGTYPIAEFGATSGGSTDYAMSLYYGHNCGANRIQGLGIEFGKPSHLTCNFYSTEDEFHNNMRQVGAGLMKLLLTAAGDAGVPKRWECCKGGTTGKGKGHGVVG